MQRPDRGAGRAGVVLLVVISLLMLFAVVGIAFVIYSQAQASTSRIWRESESARRPDMDPEALLASFLSQLLYGTDNPLSALRGHSLAETMYGRPGNSLPFNGSGRLHTHADPDQDDYYQVDYTAYSGAPRDPHQFGGRNAPYTYPDFNNMFLAAVRGSDGGVLVPSYFRPHPRPGNPPITLRPDTAYHTSFPPMSDPSGDVKNLADSPGHGGGSKDSIWIDIGFPVMAAADGRKFKPLFAPLIVDLDNRVNLNVHGNWACFPWFEGWNASRLVSHEGWGPWEVNFSHVINTGNEARNIFRGNGDVPGKYNNAGLWGNSLMLHYNYAFRGPFYSQVDFNSLHEWANSAGQGYPVPVDANNPVLRLPGQANWTSTFSFPWLHWQFHNAGCQQNDEMYSHPRLYNYFDPEWSYYTSIGKQQLRDRSFSAAQLEGLLRYRDNGSPALSSELFQLCPQSFASASTRRLVTTHSFDLLRPGVPPYIWVGPNTPSPYALTRAAHPQGQPIPPPSWNDSPQNTGEFGTDWRSLAAGLGRIDLNRPLPDYPAINGNFRITDANGFGTAERARQKLARDIFGVLRRITGAGDPADPGLPSEQRDALRWLAQLAVNIVDFTDNDNYMTPFNWSGGDWVFGAELPWLVVNEAYVEIGNTEADLGRSTAQDDLKVRFWLELHNPMDGYMYNGSQAGYTYGIHPTALTDKAIARLQIPAEGASPAYAAYQIAVSTGPLPDQPDNARGEPDPARLKLVVASYDPDPGQNPPPSVDTRFVNPINACHSPNPSGAPNVFVQTNALSGPDAGNNGYYLIGPRYSDTADDFPGTAANRPKPTLRVREQTINGQSSSLVYTLPNTTDLNQLPRHSVALRRLACPHRPPQPDPNAAAAAGYYNPYITVDHVEDVPTNDAVRVNSTGPRTMPDSVTDVSKRFSVGRNQPYAADRSQSKEQKPATPLLDQPQHTFFKINVQVTDPATGREKLNNNTPARFPFMWLRYADRPLVSPMELLVACGVKPHEQTQRFMTGGTDANSGAPNQRQGHIAPWNDGNARIHRLFEFLEAGGRLHMTPMGGRAPGRINLNTIWDIETFRALCDKQAANAFTAAEVDAIFDKLIRSRSRGPGGVPSANDRPFQFGGGDIQDSLLRSDPDDPARRLFEVNGQHPHLTTELLRKIANNVTTRSNVFAVWLTVGFFEVVDDSDPSRPARLGSEIAWLEGRHVRHRMFAIVDRTCLTLDPQNPLAFYLESLTPVANVNQPTTIQVHTLNGRYEGRSWSITTGARLVIDVGDRQETVTVSSVDAANNRFTATFTKPHDHGFAICNTVLGHPGPQPRLEPRSPLYSRAVHHFSIIE